MRIETSLLLLLGFPLLLPAQNPFQFREASMLGVRMWHSGENYSAVNSQIAGREAPTPANQFIPDSRDLNVYRSARWLGLLSETDSFRANGALAMAERQYLDILANLRQAQGAGSIDIAWMLGHLGEFYLEMRDFHKAYQNFFDAVRVCRSQIALLSQDSKQTQWLNSSKEYLVRLLVAVGRLDLAKGDLPRASQEFTEAVDLGNTYVRLLDGLHAVYFQSQLLEKQGKWKEAEELWQQATQRREKMTISDPYWDLMKEMAAFYARHGDYHTAAGIVKRVQAETAGKRLRPAMGVSSSLEEREGVSDRIDIFQLLYHGESDIAMNQILTVDRWLTDGPDAAAELAGTLQKFPTSNEEETLLAGGSDARQARFLAFLSHRAFLQMSILLDGSPPAERVQKAYAALQPFKGRYLDAIASITRLAEDARDNPHVDSAQFLDPTIMQDELGKERARHGHFFVAAALDGKKFSNLEFAASERAEQAVSEGLAWSGRYYSGAGLSAWMPQDLPAGSAFLDITAWERTDRANPAVAHREYGAFVLTNGQPLRYIRLGPAAEIDGDLTALQALVAGPHVRGFRIDPAQQAHSGDEIPRRLRRLYQEVIAPLEGFLPGVNRLLIVPDGKLTLVPMGAFLDERNQYLLQKYTVSYLRSWRELNSQPPVEPAKTKPPVVIANPDFDAILPGSTVAAAVSGRPVFESLPNAALEGRDVQQALHLSPDRVLIGAAAREEMIRSVGGPEILHFATHSVPYLGWTIPMPPYDLFEFPKSLATEDPLLQSVIVLAGGNRTQSGPEDGILTGLEIASLRLSGTKLVVLSTCEAGQGIPVDGQGVLGLRAAFSIAGARGLVMSLWPVNDQAGRLFMQFFYSHLDRGPAEAVRLAQLDMVAKTEFQQPIYWAGYAYSGEPSLTVSPSSATPASHSEFLISPTCFELKTNSDFRSSEVSYIFRVKVGGTVRRISKSADQAVYELLPPSSDLEQSSESKLNDGPPVPYPEIRSAGRSKFPVSLTIESGKDHSALIVREYVPEGDQRYKPQDILLLTLRGGPGVFGSLDIPATLPVLSSFREATALMGNTSAAMRIDTAGRCMAAQ